MGFSSTTVFKDDGAVHTARNFQDRRNDPQRYAINAYSNLKNTYEFAENELLKNRIIRYLQNFYVASIEHSAAAMNLALTRTNTTLQELVGGPVNITINYLLRIKP